jgi:hypothetical protein
MRRIASDFRDVTAGDLHAATEEMRGEWFAARNQYWRECGCETGAAGAALALGAIIIRHLIAPAVTSMRTAVLALIEAVVLIIAGAVLGKLFGVARARSRFRGATLRLLAGQNALYSTRTETLRRRRFDFSHDLP